MEEIKKITDKKHRYWELLLMADPSREMVERYLSQGEMFVLEQDGKAVAEAVMLYLPEGIWELKNIAVSEPFQGKGLGRKMMDFLKQRYREYPIQVGTSDSGVGFYQKMGFSYSHRVERFFIDHYPEPIWDNGIQCIDMIYLKKDPD